MKNRKGITLIELLAVIAVLGLIALIAVPNAIKVYNEGVLKEMVVQENNIKDAASLFLEDNCNSKLDDKASCPSSYEEPNFNDEKYICLSDLQASDGDYISKTVKFKKDTCQGVVIYEKDSKTGLYNEAKTYLYCGDSETGEYNYVTDESLNPGRYARCNIKVNNDTYYIQLMEDKLNEIHSVLQRDLELAWQATNDTNTDNDKAKLNKEIEKLNKEINGIYDYKYLGSNILHENNELTGKYVVRKASTDGLGLDKLTYSDYNKDVETIQNAMEIVSYFRASLGAEQNALDYKQRFKKCKNDTCKLEVVKDMVKRIYELAYGSAYSDASSNFDLIADNLEVQALFKNFDEFAESMKDNSVSKDAIFPNGKDTLTRDNSKKVYEDASEYIRKNLNSDLSATSVWQSQISMYQVAKGAVRDILSATEQQKQLVTACANESNTESDINSINNDLGSIGKSIKDIQDNTEFNSLNILSDKNVYKDYLIYDLNDTNIMSLSCSIPNATALKIINDYQRKVNLNVVSLNASINKADKLKNFVECNGTSCIAGVVKDILNSMLTITDKAISSDDNGREEYNIEYTTYFKALNHIAEITKNNSYSTSGLGLTNTNILTVDTANSVKTLLSSKLLEVK